MTNYSFLTSIYKNTNIVELQQCIDSMINQTLPPEQIVIVIDGEISSELFIYVEELKNNDLNLYTILPLEENVGLGLALRAGTEICRNEYIARMDTDDICCLDRCFKQVDFLDNNPEIDVVGSNIAEFIDTIDNEVGKRLVPEFNDEIIKFMKKRCPLNHMTVLIRKSSLEKSGGYLHWWLNEDSYLWARMYLVGCKFYNIQENLVFVRVGKEMYARRGGYKYYKSERDLFKFMKKNKIINWIEYQKAKFIRFVVQVLMTNCIRQWFFKRYARSR